MADKKVERNVRASDQERPSTPAQKMTASLSDHGTLNVSQAAHDRSKASLFDRFRDRDERYRRAQSLDATAAKNVVGRPAPPTASVEEHPAEGDPAEQSEDGRESEAPA